MPSASKLHSHKFFYSFYTLGPHLILHNTKDLFLSFPMRAATDATRRSLPRLSSLLENTSSETATNVVAVLPASLTDGAGRRCCTYVAVATYPSPSSALADSERDHRSSRGLLSMEDLLGSTSLPQAQMQQRPYSNSREAPATSTLGVSRPGGQAVLQLCIYTLTMPGQQPSSNPPADIAPDMMLVQTVDLYREDVRSSSTSLKATGGASGQEDAAQKDTIPFIVEQVAWVGLEYVAVKTQPHRRLLLLRSGLTSSAGSSSSSSDNNSFSTLNAGEGDLRQRPLCRVFNRVVDFSAVTLCSGSAVLFVAGMRHVTAVVSRTQEPLKGNNEKALQEHTWNIGPFTYISSAASRSSDAGSDVYLCGAAANHSVEVYRWTLHAATPPVCVHHVLTSPGSFSYSIAASSLDATRTDAAQVDFWVLAAEMGDRESEERRRQGTNTNGSSGPPAAEQETLSSLRGVDGRFFQVESAETQSAQSLRRRPLNAVWHGNTPSGTKASSEGAATDQQEHFNDASLAQLDSLVSLRIGAPRFLPTEGSSTAASEMSSTLQRYVLHLRLRNCEEARQPAQSSDTARTLNGWQSEVLSIETAECAAALRWLAEGGKASEQTAHRLSPPQWRLHPLVLARPAGGTSVGGERSASAGPLTHELLLHTSHRLLTLSVKSACNLSSPSPASVIEAGGTRALAAPERIVGLCHFNQSSSASSSLLMLHGKGHTVDGESDEEKEKREKLTVYGQKFVVPSWTAVTDICATLVQSLNPWVNVAAPVADHGAALEGREELLAAVRSVVAAEGERLQRHMDARLDRIEGLLAQLVEGKKTLLTD